MTVVIPVTVSVLNSVNPKSGTSSSAIMFLEKGKNLLLRTCRVDHKQFHAIFFAFNVITRMVAAASNDTCSFNIFSTRRCDIYLLTTWTRTTFWVDCFEKDYRIKQFFQFRTFNQLEIIEQISLKLL